MTEAEMVIELAKRAGISETDAKAVLKVVTEIAREQRRVGNGPPIRNLGTAPAESQADGASTADQDDGAAKVSYVPTDGEITDLIAAAGNHPLGLEFLIEGDLCAVAAMFRTHAFTVDAARARIRERGASLAGA